MTISRKPFINMPKAYLDGTCVWKNYYPAILYSKVLQREHLDLYINERIGGKSEMARHKLAHFVYRTAHCVLWLSPNDRVQTV